MPGDGSMVASPARTGGGWTPDGWIRGGWRPGWVGAFWSLAGLTMLAFALAPGELASKARLALHGLCAQIPGHTFALGGVPLPFDARMTGLYLGALVAALPLLLGRRRGLGIGWGWLALLAAGVMIMGMDGLNSLRVDLGLAAWWWPDNRLRLGSGLLAGLGLGVALTWLLNIGLWPMDGPLLRRGDGPLWLLGLALAGRAVLSGVGWAYAPLALLLLGAALLAVLALNLALLGLLSGPPTGAGGLARLATLALSAALAEIALLAGARLAVEMLLGRVIG